MYSNKLLINIQQLLQNISVIRSLLPNDVKYLLPIKSNAYGHGAVTIAKITEYMIDYFGVANIYEAIELRTNSIVKPILIFGTFVPKDLFDVINNNIEITIASLYKAKEIKDFCNLNNMKIKVQIKVDTGLNRIGMRSDTVIDLIDFIICTDCFIFMGLYSHLVDSNCNDITQVQCLLFQQTLDYINSKYNVDYLAHMLNSMGVINYQQYYLNMVRPGILSYGVCDIASQYGINPCMHLESEVVFIKGVRKGYGIGYEHTYTTSYDTLIATVPIGYGHGYRRSLSNVGRVLINEKFYNIVGNVCMDMLMIEVDSSISLGDKVILIGQQGEKQITFNEIAHLCDTITYEVLCNLSDSIPRVYLN